MPININVTINDEQVSKAINDEVKAQMKTIIRTQIDNVVQDMIRTIIETRLTPAHINNLIIDEIKRTVYRQKNVSEPHVRAALINVVKHRYSRRKAFWESLY